MTLDEALYWPQQEDVAFIYCQTLPEKKVWITDWPNIDFTKFNFADKTYAEKINYQHRNINGIAIILGQTIHKDYYIWALDFDGWDAVERWFGSWDNVLKVAQQTRIEWHGDKGHIHVLFKSKTQLGDGKFHRIDIGNAHVEIRVTTQLLFSWPSPHPEGGYFGPLGTTRIYEQKPGELSKTWDKISMLAQENFSDIDRRNYYEELEKKVMSTGDGRHFGLKDLGIWYYTRYKGEWLDLTDDQRYQDLCKWNEKQTPPKPKAELDDMWNWIVRTHKEWRDKTHEEAREKRTKFENNEPEKNKRKAVEALIEVMALYRFATFEETDEILYWDHGVYLHGGEVVIRKTIENIFGEEATIHLCREVLDHVRRATYHKRKEFDDDLNIINLKNGLYYILEDKLDPHTADYLSLNQKPFPYDVNAIPSAFGKFLSEVVYFSDVNTLVELMGYTFYRDNPFEIITFCHGFGGNGKSVLFGVLTALHGDDNVSHVSLKTILERPFGLYELVDKDVNLDAELSSGLIEDTALLKKITGRERTYVEQKNQMGFYARIHAKPWFSCNLIPQIYNATNADFRRFYVISFPETFEEDRQNPNLVYELTTEAELSGIFNILMNALRRVLKNKKISVNEKTIEERRIKYEMASNPVKTFTDLAFEQASLEASDYSLKDDVYKAYVVFCTENKLALISKESFGRKLKANEFRWEDGRRTVFGERPWCWIGHKLTVEYDRKIGNTSQETFTV